MYAIITTGGKQYKVAEGDVLAVEKLDAEPGKTVELDVLMLADGSKLTVETGEVAKAKVFAEVVEHFKGDKAIIFKFKKRKGYKRLKGHRQDLTRLLVQGISPTGTAPAKKATAAKAATAKAKKAEAAVKADDVAEKATTATATTAVKDVKGEVKATAKKPAAKKDGTADKTEKTTKVDKTDKTDKVVESESAKASAVTDEKASTEKKPSTRKAAAAKTEDAKPEVEKEKAATKKPAAKKPAAAKDAPATADGTEGITKAVKRATPKK